MGAGILKLYEQKLKTMNPTAARITYDIKDLYDYIDSLVDMSCLVYALYPIDIPLHTHTRARAAWNSLPTQPG